MYKPIPNTNNYYSCDKYGHIKSNQRIIHRSNGHDMTIHERILKPKLNNQGYYYVSLRINKTTHDYLVHRLVALTWLPNPNNLPTINHKDCNPKNNAVTNLEWCTQGYNNQYSFTHGKAPIGGKRIDMYNLQHQFQQTFNTQSDASIFIKGDKSARSNIGFAAKHGNPYYNHYWKYHAS